MLLYQVMTCGWVPGALLPLQAMSVSTGLTLQVTPGTLKGLSDCTTIRVDGKVNHMATTISNLMNYQTLTAKALALP